jgi:hypothetical protein
MAVLRRNRNDRSGLPRPRHPSLFGIYDVMRIGDGELTYPVPWAISAASSAWQNQGNTAGRYRRPVLR